MSRYIFAFMVFVTVFVGWSSWAPGGLPALFSSIGVGTMPPIITASFGDQSANNANSQGNATEPDNANIDGGILRRHLGRFQNQIEA